MSLSTVNPSTVPVHLASHTNVPSIRFTTSFVSQGAIDPSSMPTLTITTHDLGNSGSGGILSDTDSVAITWASASQDGAGKMSADDMDSNIAAPLPPTKLAAMAMTVLAVCPIRSIWAAISSWNHRSWFKIWYRSLATQRRLRSISTKSN